MTEKNIVLIGFMGTGKSTVGRILANRISRPFLDIDSTLEERQKMKISEIFEKQGEIFFRNLEKNLIVEVSGLKGYVITTGGGAVMDQSNFKSLQSNGILVALTASAETIYQRVKGTRHRPLLKSGDLMAEIIKLLAARKPFYDKADISICSDGKAASKVADEIIHKLSDFQEYDYGKDWF